MLKQRVLTAAVLLAVFIAALSAPTPMPFLALTLLLIAAGGWEWSRLAGWPGWPAWGSGALCAALGLAAWQAHWPGDMLAPWWIAGVAWIVGGSWLLRRGVARWPALPRWLRWGIGMVMMLAAWLAMAQARARGVNFLLSALALVWAADIAAYFCGRALGGKLTGGRKLALAISPGKSWEGAAGGFIGVLLTGAIWIGVDHAYQLSHSLYTILWQRGPVWFAGALALLTAMSIVGDLTESLVKRAAGVKDSSALLPGHGGVLDRMDALLPTLPLALAITGLAAGRLS
ncbi:MAG: phosphatidate cytidylyltransferase [Azoarcus sp.]|jgi:phosphatidate cytidylyltransferase|nr:phosphatidate cytidylyltransferase [Azoarcus sp.]